MHTLPKKLFKNIKSYFFLHQVASILAKVTLVAHSSLVLALMPFNTELCPGDRDALSPDSQVIFLVFQETQTFILILNAYIFDSMNIRCLHPGVLLPRMDRRRKGLENAVLFLKMCITSTFIKM
jgi:hypothetical protein